MDKNVKAVFDDVCSGVKINTFLVDKILRYQKRFITKNQEHAEFFGGNLTGVNVVRFTPADRSEWFEDIIGVDEKELTPRCNEQIDPNYYIVAGDVFSLSCVWLAHTIRNSNLATKTKHDAQVSLMSIMQYRFITSRLSRHWPYPTSKEVAEATLASMSNKYAIKRKGSWNAVIKDRSEDIVGPSSIHRLTLDRMEHDIRNQGESVGYLLTDTQGRNKDLIKNIYNQQKIVQESGMTVNTTSSTFIELDGNAMLKDKQKTLEMYKSYLNTIIPDKPSFIKLELVSLIEGCNKTMPTQLFRTTLSWFSDNYGKPNQNGKFLVDLTGRQLDHLIAMIYANKNIMRNKNDFAGLLTKVKGTYTASRVSDDVLLSIREDMEEVVRMATKSKVPAAVSATRTGLMLYLVIRAFTMKHYQG